MSISHFTRRPRNSGHEVTQTHPHPAATKLFYAWLAAHHHPNARKIVESLASYFPSGRLPSPSLPHAKRPTPRAPSHAEKRAGCIAHAVRGLMYTVRALPLPPLPFSRTVAFFVLKSISSNVLVLRQSASNAGGAKDLKVLHPFR